ncbi:hypothetical protein [Acidovorax sp. PRC11]|uniref:hypothetical protein n=1 Tax=Acidovorax sp. PRC11 TaxID=2962592 RepID=UPI002882BEED|nr:hypothetical protein [Acidovorax sp. PRC11]MDT0137292.1 hypothetical protein [Acidovorax sp. PRC11]
MSKEMLKDIAGEAAKVSPPIAVVGTSIAKDWTINHTVAALTIVYLLLQIAWLVWRWRRAARGGPIVEE